MELTLAAMEKTLTNFWDTPISKEDVNVVEEEYCKQLFLEKHTRSADGRYHVQIPWREESLPLGNSYTKAVLLYLGQETRWLKNPEHKKLSDEFMEEYLKLGHMESVPENMQHDTLGKVYYIIVYCDRMH